MNEIAPSLIPAQHIEFLGLLVPAMVQPKLQNYVAVLMPQFVYKKGQLSISTRTVEDLFLLSGLNMDTKWVLRFEENQMPGMAVR